MTVSLTLWNIVSGVQDSYLYKFESNLHLKGPFGARKSSQTSKYFNFERSQSQNNFWRFWGFGVMLNSPQFLEIIHSQQVGIQTPLAEHEKNIVGLKLTVRLQQPLCNAIGSDKGINYVSYIYFINFFSPNANREQVATIYMAFDYVIMHNLPCVVFAYANMHSSRCSQILQDDACSCAWLHNQNACILFCNLFSVDWVKKKVNKIYVWYIFIPLSLQLHYKVAAAAAQWAWARHVFSCSQRSLDADCCCGIISRNWGCSASTHIPERQKIVLTLDLSKVEIIFEVWTISGHRTGP